MLALAPLSEGYVGYCDANAARQPIQVILLLSEHSTQQSWVPSHLAGRWRLQSTQRE